MSKNFASLDFIAQQEANFFEFKKNKHTIGLGIIYFDKDYMLRRRLVIGHFSVIRGEEHHLNDCFVQMMEEIKAKDHFSELRIGIQHQGEPLEVNPTF